MTTPLRHAAALLPICISLWAANAHAQAAPFPPEEAPAAAPVPAPEQPAEQPAAIPAPSTDAPSALPQAAAPAAYGSLEVVTDQPGAEVLIDGARVGRTPLRVDGLSAGQHQVSITREGGAPLVREVTVQDGLTVRMDASVAGGPARPMTGAMNGATPAATAPAGQAPTKSMIPGREFFSGFLEQPWAWVAAAITGVVMLGAAILWTASAPAQVIPFGLGEQYLGSISGNDPRWLVLKWGTVIAAAVLALITLGLFLWPSLPFSRFVQLPNLGTIFGFGKKDDKPAAAPAPAAPASPPPPQK